MRRGEVWWADLPPPAGRRPVVLLSRNEAYAVRQLVIVAPITTRVRRIPTEVPLGPEEGLPKACVINLDTLTTIPKHTLTQPIGPLPPGKLAAVERALRFALDLAVADSHATPHARVERREVVVHRGVARAVADRHRDAVAAVPARRRDDAVGHGAHRRADRRRVVDGEVRPDAAQDRVRARVGEAGRDARELEWRLEEALLERAPVEVVERITRRALRYPADAGEHATGAHVLGDEDASVAHQSLARLRPLAQRPQAATRPPRWGRETSSALPGRSFLSSTPFRVKSVESSAAARAPTPARPSACTRVSPGLTSTLRVVTGYARLGSVAGGAAGAGSRSGAG